MTTADSTTSLEVRAKEVLQMWLRWHEASQRLTERMFAERDHPENVEQMLDDVERLRQQAVAASQQILDEGPRS